MPSSHPIEERPQQPHPRWHRRHHQRRNPHPHLFPARFLVGAWHWMLPLFVLAFSPPRSSGTTTGTAAPNSNNPKPAAIAPSVPPAGCSVKAITTTAAAKEASVTNAPSTTPASNRSLIGATIISTAAALLSDCSSLGFWRASGWRASGWRVTDHDGTSAARAFSRTLDRSTIASSTGIAATAAPTSTG